MNDLPLPVSDGRIVLDPERLKTLRKKLGLSQSALAERCFDRRLCVSIASIKRAEAGKSLLYRTARHLAQIYQVELESMLLPNETWPQEMAAQESPLQLLQWVNEEEPRNVIGLFLAASALSPAMLAECSELARQFGATVLDASSAHQGFVAVFGIPRAYRSDGLRCMQCALEIAARLKALGPHLSRPVVIDTLAWPQAQAGANWPATAVWPADDGLQAPAIHVERGLSQMMANRFAFTPCDEHFLRYSHPLRSEQLPLNALIGRDVEVCQLKAVLVAAVTYQAGHTVYIRGVAGIGKTRLSQEFTDMAQQNRLGCHAAAVLDFGDEGAAGWLGQLVCSLLRLVPDSGGLEAQLAGRLQKLRLPADDAMFYRPLLGLAQTPEHAPLYAAMGHTTRGQRQLEALHALLLREAMEHPAVLLLEDLHWADSATLDLLGALMQRAADVPIIWVLTSRLEQDPLERALRPYLTDLPLTVLDLAPLRSVAANALTLQFPDADPGYRHRCVARAQGNPLFLTQLLLSRQTRVLPESLQNLVQSKLDQLDPLDRRALRVAAVIGQRFSLELLRAVLEAPDYLPQLPQHHYLIRQIEPGLYQFIHDLILQGIYEAMAPVQREFLHAQLAQQYAHGDTELCAQHLYKARSPLAPQTFVAAIGEKIARHQYEKALELIQQCRAIDYTDKQDHTLSLLAGQATMNMGLTQEARVHYESAMQYARSDTQRLTAIVGLARTLNLLEELEAEEALLDQALPQAEALGEHAVSAHLYYLKGNIYFPRGNFARSRELHLQALHHARRSGTVELEVRALSGLGDSHYAEGHMLTALESFRTCVHLCEQHGLAEVEASNRFMLATTRIYANETEPALRDALASAELGLRVGNRRAEIVSRLTAGWLLLSLARTQEAQTQIEQGLALARAMGATRFEAFLLESLARVHLANGQQELARHQIRSAWQIVERQRLQHFIGPWVLGTLALLEERKAQRTRALEQGHALLEQGCVGHNYYRFYVSAAEACLIHGDVERARQFADHLERFTAQEPCAWSDHHVALIRRYGDWLCDPSPGHRQAVRTQLEAGARAGLAMVTPCLNMLMLQAESAPRRPGPPAVSGTGFTARSTG